jgi:hypothetical protein
MYKVNKLYGVLLRICTIGIGPGCDAGVKGALEYTPGGNPMPS